MSPFLYRSFHFRSPANLWLILALTFLLTPLVGLTPAVGQLDPIDEIANQNSLLKEYQGKVTYSASSFWAGWPVAKAFDGDRQSSWFSAQGDTASSGTQTNPWLEIRFPVDTTVARVTVWGNRQAPWATGYSVLSGRIEMYDDQGTRIYSSDQTEGIGDHYDFDFIPVEPVRRVRRLRFVSIRDQGAGNSCHDMAIGEIEIE